MVTSLLAKLLHQYPTPFYRNLPKLELPAGHHYAIEVGVWLNLQFNNTHKLRAAQRNACQFVARYQ